MTLAQKKARESFVERLKESALNHGLVDPIMLGYIMATVGWETAHTYKPVVEAFWLSDSYRKRHFKYYPYYGRGYVQITWKKNYKKFSKILGIDLVGDPDLALDPDVAMEILIIGFMEGLFTGKKLSDYFTGSKKDRYHARRIINGLDKAKTIASMAEDESMSFIA